MSEESTLRPWIEDGRLCGSVEITDDEVVLELLVDVPRFRQEYEGNWTPPGGPS